MRNLGNNIVGSGLLLKAAFGLMLFSVSGLEAQSVPADLLDLSIEELFKAEISDHSESEDEKRQRWHLSLKYQKSEFEQYRKGSEKLSVDDVLFTPGQEQRTNDNFPVVPREINQQVYAIIIGYDLSDRISLGAAVPFVKQSTNHVSIVPGYSAFNITSSGIGDFSLVGTYRLSSGPASDWYVGAGISVPTGSIDQQGDTPRAAGDQQLPYSMQLGSGTFDIPFHVT